MRSNQNSSFMKKRIILFSILCAFILGNNFCRYKDNEMLSILTVKKRLNRTWLLKEATSDGINLIERDSKMLNEELQIELLKDDKLFLTTAAMNVGCVFKDKKTKIYPGGGIDPKNYHLTITKLTNKELWLEGNPILGLCRYTSVVSDFVKLKYSAK